ncbi:ABC transporter ATP-binding protein [Actinomyces sp. MRS3W]|uniref:ABC transporter ATP-binding protein n=1 Tax=Actinomyces sp. MRS3W TaxID=2800796 RepID=UPI0028FD80C3|nr:ATP-binding cassette domain-containing protein [Actinomyces sp. MRS3W]MDU0347897.1 ATP-binding cassette domain-containing protein [Actinomyces sp. MRS3W]
MSRSCLAAVGLSRSYPSRSGTHTVLHGVTVTIHREETVALLGRSGCGKTTLLKALVLLDRPAPGDAGNILLDGRPVTGMRRPGARQLHPYRRAVQYVPQNPAASLDPRRDVLTQITGPLRTLGVSGSHRQHEETAIALLEALDLPHSSWRRRPHEISGGQAQRLAVARALAPSPRFLLLDEPVSGLDPGLRRQVLDLLVGLAGGSHAGTIPRPALLIVSHDLAAVARVCARCVVMDGGRLVEDAATDELLQAPTHPAARALRDAVPALPD